MRQCLRHWRRCSTNQAVRGARCSIRSSSLLVASPLLRRTSPIVYEKVYDQRWIRGASNYAADKRSQWSHNATIYALSTAPGRAAIAIVRISGPACLDIYRALCPDKPDPKPRYATLRTLFKPRSREEQQNVLDGNALVFYFPAPKTVTGEDVLELHIHGGPAVVKAVLKAIPEAATAIDGSLDIRYAEPGEFTKRAFYNDRLDLTQVEALGDTLAAETEQQRKMAVNGSTSALANRYDAWQQQLLYARGELEAIIDFSEDQHFDESPAALCTSVTAQVQALQRQLRASIEGASKGELLRRGITIALVGPPNAGKSSLLNRILGREAAIVSSQPGTTRDVIEVSVDIGGYLCRFLDLAGLRALDDLKAQGAFIEQEGMRRTNSRAAQADIVIAFLSSEHDAEAIDRVGGLSPKSSKEEIGSTRLDPRVRTVLDERTSKLQKTILVLNKADLFSTQNSLQSACEHVESGMNKSNFNSKVIPISCLEDFVSANSTTKGPGVEPLLKELVNVFREMTEQDVPSEVGQNRSDSFWTESLGATERQRILLEQCLEHLENFLAEVHQPTNDGNAMAIREDEEIDIVLAAEHLRSAASCLAKITGRGEMSGDVEQVLGVVFEKFCVGK